MAATPCTRLEPQAREQLLLTAAVAIEAALAGRPQAPPDPAVLPPQLAAPRASFVTLTIGGRLRGCCGSLEARHPLAVDVWRNAQASAFRDARFDPLKAAEWPSVDLEISVLSPLERIDVRSEAELLRSLRPGRDGLVISWHGRRATFLPKVWGDLPAPATFLEHLRSKAGWAPGFWSADVECWRYETETFALDRPAARLATRGG